MKLLNPDGKANIHTHTCYCDGKDTPEELVQAALAAGMRTLGFSGHGYGIHDEDYCMSRENTLRYREEILDLKDRYRGRIEILLGVERDFYGEHDDGPWDFIIGSVHSVEKDGVYLSVDNTAEIMEANVEKYFGGDYRAYVERYYETVSDVVSATGGGIVGHFDLITKFNEGSRYFDEEAVWYRKAALHALAKAAETRPVFEINTGAMARGYRSVPHPAPFLLEEIQRLGCPVILSSDCHDRAQLDFGFEEIIRRFE
ncbi:MAG: histidinol-phosphatase HisJ family protein [Emergencia sp.]